MGALLCIMRRGMSSEVDVGPETSEPEKTKVWAPSGSGKRWTALEVAGSARRRSRAHRTRRPVRTYLPSLTATKWHPRIAAFSFSEKRFSPSMVKIPLPKRIALAVVSVLGTVVERIMA